MGFSTIIITSKKIVAVALTAAMCLGMSMTAFASNDDNWSNDPLWSPTNILQKGPTGIKAGPTTAGANGWYQDDEGNWHWTGSQFIIARDADGHEVDVSWKELSPKTLDSIDKEKKVADIFKKNGYDVPDDTDFIPLLSGDIAFDNGVPAGGGIVTFQLADLAVDSQHVRPGDTLYVMQEVSPGSGVWDVYAAKVGENYDVVVTLPRNGALVLVKTLSNGSVIALDKTTGEVISTVPNETITPNTPNGQTATSTTASGTTATSPKTGEF